METKTEKEKKEKSFWDKLHGLAWLLIIYFALEALFKWWWKSCKTASSEKNWFKLALFIVVPILLIIYINRNMPEY